jgi:hypothetical protein
MYTTDKTVKQKTSSYDKTITIPFAEYLFYQKLEQQFKDVRQMEMEVADAIKEGKSYDNADDFIDDLLCDDQ